MSDHISDPWEAGMGVANAIRDQAERMANKAMGRERLPEKHRDDDWDEEYAQALQDMADGAADDACQRAKDAKIDRKS